MKEIPPELDLTLFSKAHFAMGDNTPPKEPSQSPSPFFFHGTSTSSSSNSPFHPSATLTHPQEHPKDISSLYKTYPMNAPSAESSSSGYNTPTHFPNTDAPFDPFMSMMHLVDSHHYEPAHPPAFENIETPINAAAGPSSSSSPSPSTPSKPSSRRKGKAAAVIPPSDPEDNSDSDPFAVLKRRRNTEASARFRVKKKMREQVLRRTADETTLRSQQLQQRVHELEKEIKWLRELIVEKKKKEDK